MIFDAFLKALAQIGDPRFRGILWRGIGLTIALLVGAYAALLALIEWLTQEPLSLPLVGEVTWIGDLLGWGSLIFMLIASVFLMVPVASAITSLFLDEVADAVEAHYYPRVPRPPRIPFWDAVRDTVNFLGVLIAVNIFALILYVMFPPATPVIFVGINGYLLGREYFTISAMRHLGREGARTKRKEHAGVIWVAGCLMAVPLTLPLVNLFIPILGAATFTHIFHRLNGGSRDRQATDFD
ncbi:MAG: EI24 domain-containing protein [Pseudomonadota bacterium]